jgi:hypothetical protein
MARSRNIKPGFYKNEDLAECSVWARLIFPGLWMLADREGRLEDRPKRIKGELLPFDGQDVDSLLKELAAKTDAQGVPFIVRYRNKDGAFIQISKFSTHQSPHYSEKPSIIKPPRLPEIVEDEGVGTPGNASESSAEKPRKPPPIKRGSQPPDSLIHRLSDSLNPESLEETTPAISRKSQAGSGRPGAGVVPPDGEGPRHIAQDLSLDALRVGPGCATVEGDKAGELWAVLHANGCKGTASHPAVIEMARQGVTVKALKAAIIEARKSREGPLNPAYLAAIVDRQSTEKPANGKAQAWATDEGACEAKARELGLWPAKAGEDWNGLRSRIRATLTNRAEESVR